ncbi:MAG: hypothetical protein ABSB22_03800 [Thermodesulfobacteriota bacterium]|jgi:hypothetical protein
MMESLEELKRMAKPHPDFFNILLEYRGKKMPPCQHTEPKKRFIRLWPKRSLNIAARAK